MDVGAKHAEAAEDGSSSGGEGGGARKARKQRESDGGGKKHKKHKKQKDKDSKKKSHKESSKSKRSDKDAQEGGSKRRCVRARGASADLSAGTARHRRQGPRGGRCACALQVGRQGRAQRQRLGAARATPRGSQQGRAATHGVRPAPAHRLPCWV